MNDHGAPVAARNDPAQHDHGAPVAARNDPAQHDPAAIRSNANLHVQVTDATRRFHLWQQAPAWILGFAAIGLGFLMVLRGYDSAAGWFAVSTSIVLAVIASFRSPFSIGETAMSTQPGRRPRKKPVTTPTNPPTGA
jgi:hypothetical protein